MKKSITRKTKLPRRTIADLAKLQLKSHALPALSSIEKAKLENNLAIEQLYYSSKVEGTNLTDTMIERAIHGRKVSTP